MLLIPCRTDIKSKKVPVLIYAPPPSTAKQMHAERVFCDGSKDSNGPPCLLKGSDKKINKSADRKQPCRSTMATTSKKSAEFIVNDDDDDLNNSDTHEGSSSDDDGPNPSPRLTRSRSRAREMPAERDSEIGDGQTRGKSVTIDETPTGAPAVVSKPTRAQPKSNSPPFV